MASLLASGLSSSVVGTMAGQTIMEDFVGFRTPHVVRRLLTMVPAFVVVAMGVDPTEALVISQVVLSLVLPVPMIALADADPPARRDGGFAIGRRDAVLPCGGTVVVLGLNMVSAGAKCRDMIRPTFGAVSASNGPCAGWPIAQFAQDRPCRRNRTQAIRFGKARTAQSGALLEDYVELISDLLANGGEARPTDIARRLGVSHATAIKTIGRLKREGLAVAKPYRGVFLTEAAKRWPTGYAPAIGWWSICCWRSAFPLEAAEPDAEGIEHHVSDTTLAAFARFLARG